MNYLLDTNILVIYGRATSIADKIENQYNLFNPQNNLGVSVVTLGELDSLAKQFKYGDKRKEKLNSLVDSVFKIDINTKKIIQMYGEIDAFSQGKLTNNPLLLSPRNMGKNDLWIAATAAAYDMELITTDKDFAHLADSFLKVNYIDIKLFK